MAIGTPTSLGTAVASAVTATTRTFTTSVTAPSNSLIIAPCFWGAVASQTGVMSGGSLSWGLTGTGTPEQTNAFGFSGFTFSTGIFSAPAAAGLASGTVLTLTTSAGVDASIAVYAVTGMDLTGSRKDVSNGQGALTANWDSGSATNTVPDVLLIGGSMVDGSAFGGVMSSTPAGSATELDDVVNAGDDWAFTTTYQIVAATASQNLAGTWAASANQVSAFVAYKAAAAAAAAALPPRTFNAIPFMTGVL
jgi:hypothetical protein